MFLGPPALLVVFGSVLAGCSLVLPDSGLSGGGAATDAGDAGETGSLNGPKLVDCANPASAGDLRCRPISALSPGTVGAGPAIDWVGIPKQEIVGGAIDGNELFVAVRAYETSGTGGVLAIHLETGERRLVAGSLRTPEHQFVSRGTGYGFQDTTNLTLSPGGPISVHTWQEFGFEGWILEVDRATGDRGARAIGTTCYQVLPESLLPQQFRHPAIAPDTAAYVMGDSVQGQALVKQLGDQCELLKTLEFDSPGFNPHALRWAEGKIWSTDDDGQELSSIDLANGSAEVVSDPSMSAILIGRDDVAVGPNRIFTVGGAGEILITEIDRKTGARKAHRSDVGPLAMKPATPQNAWLHPTVEALIVEVDGAIVVYDPATDVANTLSY